MNNDETSAKAQPTPPVEIETACGNRIRLAPNTPWVLYRDEVIYFCTQDCKENYLKDPLNSCLAGRILMDRKR